MSRLITIILMIALQSGIAAARLSSADSIRRLIPHLHGQAKLDALSNLCDIVGNGDDESAELKCLDEYIAEARRQKNIEDEVYSVGCRMFCFFNYNDEKRLSAELPAALDMMGKYKRWNDCYDSWRLLPNLYLSENKLRLAIIEARKMYEDARSRNSDYGLGAAEYVIGMAYYAQENIPEAVKAFGRSLVLLKKCNDRSILFNVYTDYCDVLFSQSDYKKIRKLTAEWRKILDSYILQYKANKLNLTFFDVYNKYYYIASAQLEMNTGHLDKAGVLFRKAEKLAEGGKEAARLPVLQKITDYYLLKKDFSSALRECRAWEAASKNINDICGVASAKEKEAEVLMAMGRRAEASFIYQKLLPYKDSMSSARAKSQLDELNTIYKLDELKSAKERMNIIVIAVAECSFLLILFLTLYIIYLRRVRAKNRAIYENLKKMVEDGDKKPETPQPEPDKELSEEELLYRRICDSMQSSELFRNASMNRNDIAAEVGTNYNYVSSAIRNCGGGISVNEFLNNYRLSYSLTLLTENPNLSINEISDKSGFKSRISFYRQFRKKYAISPTEFRNASALKK